MRSISIKIFTGFLALSLIMIVFNSLTSANIFSFISNNFISQAQKINSTESSSNLSSGAANHTVLSLIPLMIKEMENTNATTIPIKQVINATPSNVTALQNMAKNNLLNNISKINFLNNTGSSTIGNNTVTNNTILNNISAHNNFLNNTGSNNKINNSNSTTTAAPINKTNLIPVVVNLTKNTNATEIAIAKTINATPSNVTALQKLSNNNILNNISKTIGNTISISNTKNLTR
jgi:hypothetical protein